MKRIIIIIIALMAALTGYHIYSIKQRRILNDKIAFYQSIADSEAEWIKGLQLSNGALAFRPKEDGTAVINPYFADYSAMALLRAGDGKAYAGEVKEYLKWHFSHLNDSSTDKNGIDGTIYEYEAELKDGVVAAETTERQYDSVDSYAASFLALLWDYYRYTGDSRFLMEQYDEILRVLNAIDETMEDGLTVTKPDYPVKYLMDNSEVYEGLVCAVSLYDNVFLPGLKQSTGEYEEAQKMYDKLIKQKDTLYKNIEDKMWNEPEGHYATGIQNGSKAIASFNWSTFYPDAASQLFPIIHGALDRDSGRAKKLYETFGKNFSWEDFEHYTKGIADFYWGRLPYAAAVMKDEGRVKSYMTYYMENVMPEHNKPLYNADAAWVVMASRMMIDSYKAKLRWLL